MSELSAEVTRLQKGSGAEALRARLQQLRTSEARARSILGSGEISPSGTAFLSFSPSKVTQAANTACSGSLSSAFSRTPRLPVGLLGACQYLQLGWVLC